MGSFINIRLLVVICAITTAFASSFPQNSTETAVSTSSIRTSSFTNHFFCSSPSKKSCLLFPEQTLLILPPLPQFPSPPKKQIDVRASHEPTMSSQITTTLTNPITVTLLIDPRIHLKEWVKSVHKHARSLIYAQDEYGALALVCDNNTWALLKRNIIADANGGAPTIRERPVYERPDVTAGSDSAGVRQAKSDQRRQFDAAANAESELVRYMLDTVGPTNCLLLEDAGTDLLDVTAREICDCMILAHGVLQMSDIQAIRKPLFEPLTNAGQFLSHANVTRLIHVTLKQVGTPYLDLDQYNMFKLTLSNLTDFLPYDIQYAIQYPLLTQQILTSYVTFITPHLPAIQSRAAQNPFMGLGAEEQLCRLKRPVVA